MNMIPSRVLGKLRNGEPATGTKINSADPRMAEIAAAAGFDCIWLCNEHVPTDWLALENLVRAAKVHRADTMVRVSRGSYSDYVRPLEMDATGIMVPHVMNAQQAREVVRMTRFHPVGRRPIDGGNLDGFFCKIPVEEYVQTANDQRFVCVQIEDPEAMAELDEIAAVAGIDMLFFGPGDFSHGIGKAGQTNAPEVASARRAVAEAAARHGKFASTSCGLAAFGATRDMGYQFINVGADVVGLVQYFDGLAEAIGIEP